MNRRRRLHHTHTPPSSFLDGLAIALPLIFVAIGFAAIFGAIIASGR